MPLLIARSSPCVGRRRGKQKSPKTRTNATHTTCFQRQLYASLRQLVFLMHAAQIPDACLMAPPKSSKSSRKTTLPTCLFPYIHSRRNVQYIMRRSLVMSVFLVHCFIQRKPITQKRVRVSKSGQNNKGLR